MVYVQLCFHDCVDTAYTVCGVLLLKGFSLAQINTTACSERLRKLVLLKKQHKIISPKFWKCDCYGWLVRKFVIVNYLKGLRFSKNKTKSLRLKLIKPELVFRWFHFYGRIVFHTFKVFTETLCCCRILLKICYSLIICNASQCKVMCDFSCSGLIDTFERWTLSKVLPTNLKAICRQNEISCLSRIVSIHKTARRLVLHSDSILLPEFTTLIFFKNNRNTKPFEVSSPNIEDEKLSIKKLLNF